MNFKYSIMFKFFIDFDNCYLTISPPGKNLNYNQVYNMDVKLEHLDTNNQHV
jgi:hypothetical protein